MSGNIPQPLRYEGNGKREENRQKELSHSYLV